MQNSLFAPKITWKAPELSSLPSWKGVKRLAIDCETCDPQLKKLGIGVRRGGYITGVSFAIEGGPKHYLPMRHVGGGNLDPQAVLGYLRENAAEFDGQLVGAKISYDLDYLWAESIFFPKVSFIRDIQVAEPLIDENQWSFGLAKIGTKYGIEAKDEELLRKAALEFKIDPKAEMYLLEAGYVGAYAEQDAVSPLLILREQEKEIEKQDLWDIWNLESKVTPVLVKMRARGVKIDQDKLAQVEEYSRKEAAKAMKDLHRQTGVLIDPMHVMNNNQCKKLFDAAEIKLGKTATGKWQIDQTVLEATGELGATLNWARKISKLRTTFAQSIRNYMVDGRIHCTFNQIAMDDGSGNKNAGARYGRLSAVDPNLQQQPSRDDFADFWRSIYIPEDGAIWDCNDYSQQEPRWTTHFAAIMGFTGAPEMAKRYRENPALDNHSMMTRLVHGKKVDSMNAKQYKSARSGCKAIFLGLCYGEGGAKLCKDLGLPTRWALCKQSGGVQYFENRGEALAYKQSRGVQGFLYEAAGGEGQKVLDGFDQKVPYVRLLASQAKRRVDKKGFIRTVGGRNLHFPVREDGNYDFTHKSLNRLIQGSSADQTKAAMVAIDREMPDTFMQLQVHDEINSSVASVQEAKQIAEIMSNCVPNTLVPFKVDIEIGPSWGEIEDVSK